MGLFIPFIERRGVLGLRSFFVPFCIVTVEELQGNPKPLKTLKPETLIGCRVWVLGV